MDALILGTLQGAIYALFALGLALVFSVMRLVNFAHGDVLTMGMYALVLGGLVGLTPVLALPAVVVFMAVLGMVFYRLLFARSFSVEHSALAQIFAAVGASIAIQNGILEIFGPNSRRAEPLLAGGFRIAGLGVSWGRVVPILALTACGVFVWWLFQRTTFGTRVRAVAENREAARLVGLHVDRLYQQVTAISFALIGVAAVVMAPLFTIRPLVGFSIVLVAFMAVVIGGLGSITGGVIGGFVLGYVEAFSATYVSPLWAPGFMYLVFLIVLLLRPHGLLGDPDWSIE